ncbi:MAG: hypothetical protein ACOY46_14045 [Bacillota bacterium]
MRLKSCLTLLIFSVILFAAGCGGGNEKAATTAESSGGAKEAAKVLVEPASLLTKAEAEAALGGQVKEPEIKDTKNPLGQKICFYAPVSEKEDRFIQISVVQNEGMSKNLRDTGYNVKELYEETKKNLADTKPVPGFGDDAFWGTNGLHILKGSFYVNIAVGNTSRPENLEFAKGLAEKVVSRL